MLKILRSSRGQAIIAEYVVVLMVVIAAVALMFTYTKRTFQAKVRDAQRMAVSSAYEGVEGSTNVYMEYEPYYVRSESRINSRQEDYTHIASGGLFNKTTDSGRHVDSFSVQYAPGTSGGP